MIVVYPGTFDPFTNGHLDVVLRGKKLFGSIIVAVADSEGKNPLFTAPERVGLIKDALKGLKNIEVKSFNSLLVDFLAEQKADVVLRGLRETSDFPFEFQQALMNKALAPKIETVFVMTNPENSYITSSIVKEIALLSGDVSKLVPKNVQKKLKEKVKARK